MNQPHTIKKICNALTNQGYPELAKRIAYFASDEDLEEGDVPVTPESTLGFWEPFKAVDSEGRLGLTCSSEGWLCGSWDFSDARGATLWFLDSQRVMFAATGTDGKFIRIASAEDTGSREVLSNKDGRGRFVFLASEILRQLKNSQSRQHAARYCQNQRHRRARKSERKCVLAVLNVRGLSFYKLAGLL